MDIVTSAQPLQTPCHNIWISITGMKPKFIIIKNIQNVFLHSLCPKAHDNICINDGRRQIYLQRVFPDPIRIIYLSLSATLGCRKICNLLLRFVERDNGIVTPTYPNIVVCECRENIHHMARRYRQAVMRPHTCIVHTIILHRKCSVWKCLAKALRLVNRFKSCVIPAIYQFFNYIKNALHYWRIWTILDIHFTI